MKDSMILDMAVNEITQAVNQIANKHKIEPSLLSFAIAKVSNKVDALATQEYINEVANLEIKIEEMQSKSEPHEEVGEKAKASPFDSAVAVTNEQKKAFVPTSTSVRKTGTIKDLIKDLEASGVTVTKTGTETVTLSDEDMKELSASDSDK